MFQVTSTESTSVAVSAAKEESFSVVGNMGITPVLNASPAVVSAESSKVVAYVRPNPSSEFKSSSSYVASELISDETMKKTSKTSSAQELPLSEYMAKLSPSSSVTTTLH